MSETNESYIGRKAAAEKYRRGERTLERDISQALKVRDETFLANIRLRTKEGDLLPGVEVTFEKIDELKNSGQVPTWEIAESYLMERYGLRSEEPHRSNAKSHRSQQPEEGTRHEATQADAPSNSQPQPANETSLPPLPRDPVEQAALLKALYQDLQRSFQVERDRNDKIFALIETIPKQQEQTNILLREFQELMKSGNASLALPAKSETKTLQPPQVIEAQTVETTKIIKGEVSKRAKSHPKKSVPKKKSKKRSTKPAKKRSPKAPVKPPTFAERHLPSLSRLFGSASSKKR